MAPSRSNELETNLQPGKTRALLARALAPEDIRAGDYVAVLDELVELPSYWWPADAALHPRDELVRLRLLPTEENVPLRVKSVCLPFVFVKQPTGIGRVIDIRRARLARLDKRFATQVWKAHKPQQAAAV